MIRFAAASADGVRRPDLILLGCGRLTEGLCEALQREGAHATAIQSLATVASVIGPDPDRPGAPILVVGPGAPDVFEALDGLGALPRRPATLFLSHCQDPAIALHALDRGADDVVCPPHSAARIVLRAAILDRRGRPPREGTEVRRISPFPGLDLEPESRRVDAGGRTVHLSQREYELLERLAAARGRVVSRARLLTDIWGTDQRSEAVLDATVHRLRRKLEEDTADPRFITTVRGVGYRLQRAALRGVPSTSWGRSRAG